MNKAKKIKASPGSDRLAVRLAGIISRVQRGWSDGMARLMGKLSLKGRWAACACFILLMLALNSYLVVNSFTSKSQYLDSKVKIAVPLLPAEPLQVAKPVLPDGITQRIESFKSHIDSLGRTAEGKAQRDSILQKRNGLMDSITRIEYLYQQLNNQ